MKKLKPSKENKKETLTSENTKKSSIDNIPVIFRSDVPPNEIYVVNSDIKLDFPHDELIQALYWVWDGFERANMPMFLVYTTAEDVLQNKILEGDRVTVGVRENDWRSGSKSIVKSFLYDPLEETDKYERFKNPFNDVPVYVYIFSEDPCILSTAQVFYKNEYFMLPNTYKQFIDRFGARP